MRALLGSIHELPAVRAAGLAAASRSAAPCLSRRVGSTSPTTTSRRPTSTAEIERLRSARDAVAGELAAMQRDLPLEAPAELSALLDVHRMLLHDDALTGATQAVDPRAPLQRRVGAVGAARGPGAPVRRHGGRVPARAQGRRRAGGRAPARRRSPGAERRIAADAAVRASRAASDPLVLVARRHLAGRHAPLQGRRPSSASSPTSAARPRTPRSSRAAWTSRRSSACARRAG